MHREEQCAALASDSDVWIDRLNDLAVTSQYKSATSPAVLVRAQLVKV
jgi:hypothetical protein